MNVVALELSDLVLTTDLGLKTILNTFFGGLGFGLGGLGLNFLQNFWF